MNRVIMVVDDDKQVRELTSRVLEIIGYDSILAKNGEEAVANFKKTEPMMIFMDINMPKMDGITAAKKILDMNPNTFIYFYTCSTEVHLTNEMNELGCGILKKPALISEIKDAVELVEHLHKSC